MAQLLVVLSLAFARFAGALDMGTFAGQAEASLLQESTVETSEQDSVQMLMVAEAAEENDYSCTADRKCKIGCCKL